MKFKISSGGLKEAAKEAVRAIDGRAPMPILTSVVICQENKEIYLLAGDGECLYRVSAGAALECAGVTDGRLFCVNGSTLKDALASLAEQPITVEYDDGKTTITYANGTMEMPADKAEEYPVMKEPEDGYRHAIFAGLLQKCYAKASVAADVKNQVRPVMGCVNIVIRQDGGADIVASDGHKLVRCTLGADKLTADMEAGDGVLLPPKTRIFMDGQEGRISIRTDGQTARLASMGTGRAFTTRLVESRYPDYGRVIPEDFAYEAVADTSALMAALRRVTPFSNGSSRLVELTFHDGTLTLRAEDRDFDREAKETLPYEGGLPDLRIGFKGTALMEMLQITETESVRIRMNDPSKAAVLEPVGQSADYGLTLLLMPMVLY